ncbi:hypothetical protein BGZ61DRAFT_80385 [Ilyonectria robusta]|uniref:uncharacterized protein n=1 Tax=Ilyonectria robusta TaxID=1079257 RepID=UPI001E8D6B23|nr:uncharacterized protein BGZ61DRAFT_80385 [Ilyonectria robusta]KAH8735494.1 hypothetical protein BGZ61DRAFT_80385 [Ilyonectria robusta]
MIPFCLQVTDTRIAKHRFGELKAPRQYLQCGLIASLLKRRMPQEPAPQCQPLRGLNIKVGAMPPPSPSIGYGAELCASPPSDLRRTLALGSALLWARTGAPMLDTVQWPPVGNALRVSSCSRANSTPWASFATNAGCDPSVPSVKAGSCISSWTFNAHCHCSDNRNARMEASMCHCLAAVILFQVAIGSSLKGSIIGSTKPTHQHQSHALRTPLQCKSSVNMTALEYYWLHSMLQSSLTVLAPTLTKVHPSMYNSTGLSSY